MFPHMLHRGDAQDMAYEWEGMWQDALYDWPWRNDYSSSHWPVVDKHLQYEVEIARRIEEERVYQALYARSLGYNEIAAR